MMIIKNIYRIITLIFVLVFVSCEVTVDKTMDTKVELQINTLDQGPVTEVIEVNKFNEILYVDVTNETGEEKGSKEAPYNSVNEAISAITKENTGIFVAGGTYVEAKINMREGTHLFGGYNGDNWERDISKEITVLSGEKSEQILIAANNTTIDGFEFTKGSFQGTGSAIYCNGTSPVISNNSFVGNHVIGPLNWDPEFWHETANDGGAIYGEKGAAPKIKNNIFLNNTTENGRGAAVAFDDKCNVIIENNVFINNIAGLNDPMRSSDGGAISIFNWSNAEITNNLFLGNKALARNDGGGIFVALWSSAKISNNILVASESGDDAGALFVGGQEHRYGGAPLDPIPPKEKFYVTVDNNQFYGNKNSSLNSGAMRFTMESRGEFTNNTLALNNGVYFQRSEVAVRDNTIFDNFLFIETKEGLNQGSIENNIIWGDFELTTPAMVTGNMIRDGYTGGSDNIEGIPEMLDDGSQLNVASLTVNKKKMISHVFVSGKKYQINELKNRVVRNGEKWGIVQSNKGSQIDVWGDLYGVESIQLLPTYTVIK